MGKSAFDFLEVSLAHTGMPMEYKQVVRAGAVRQCRREPLHAHKKLDQTRCRICMSARGAAGLWLLCLALLSFPLSAQSSAFSKGEDLFRQNQPEQAIPFLKDAIKEGNSPKAYTYLALAYYQTGNFTESLNVCSAGMEAPGTNKKILAYNAGNTAFAMDDYANAESWYSRAIAADGQYAAPVLNRANARLRAGKIKECIEDYKHYLELSPQDAQYEQIKILIGVLNDEQLRRGAEEQSKIVEEKRIKEEETRIVAEEARLAAQREAAEAERRRRLFEDVAASLQNTESQNMSAGAEDTVDYGYESELE